MRIKVWAPTSGCGLRRSGCGRVTEVFFEFFDGLTCDPAQNANAALSSPGY